MTSSPHNAMNTSIDSFLLEVADAVNTTLDLNTLLQRVAEMLQQRHRLRDFCHPAAER